MNGSLSGRGPAPEGYIAGGRRLEGPGYNRLQTGCHPRIYFAIVNYVEASLQSAAGIVNKVT
jgi:hypothetical protein